MAWATKAVHSVSCPRSSLQRLLGTSQGLCGQTELRHRGVAALQKRWFCAFHQQVASGCAVANTALSLINAAWKHSGPSSGGKLPQLRLEFRQPSIGAKIVPEGIHPLQYIRELPSTADYDVAQADLSYVCPDTHSDIRIQTRADWTVYFRHRDKVPLNVRLPSKLEVHAKNNPISLSDRARKWCKDLLCGPSNDEVTLQEETKLKEVTDKLAQQGYSDFKGNAIVWEELGYTLEDWPELVDSLVEQGLPGACGKTLKLAAKAKRGSNKSLFCNDFRGGERVMHYMKLQVMPGVEGDVDALIAVYRLTAKMSPDAETNIATEQMFNCYVELDAQGRWKKEVKQFLHN